MMSNSEEPQGTAAKPEGDAASATSTPQPPRARLTRLKINRFRNVKPGTELRFDDGINVLLGRNGTGKTTLLELVCAVVRGDLRAYEQESFDLEFDMRLGASSLITSAQNTRVHEDSAALPIDHNNPRSWKIQMALSTSDTKATIEATHRGAKIALLGGSSREVPVDDVSLFSTMFHVFPFVEHWPEENRALPLSAVASGFLIFSNCLRLDEGLDVFRAIVDGASLPSLGRPLAVTSYSRPTPFRFSRWYVPLSVAEQIDGQGPSLHEVTAVALAQADFEPLDTFSQAAGHKSIRCVMTLLERDQNVKSGTTASRFGKPSFWITTHRGTTFTHDQLSYGEKRLLAFLYHAAANPQILVADELVNGMHYEWIDACLDAIQGQAFLTSQNPLLLDHLSFESAEEVQRRFILCDSDEGGNWIWRNMDIDTADAFYRAYEVGLQHVGEILRTSGLW
jgi:energy-coupling factor transporter ATP-binding protein EcfA2